MRYLSPEQRKGNKEVRQYLGSYVSQSIKHNLPLRMLERYQPDTKAAILDAGSASGAFLKQLGEAGYLNLYGLDLEKYVAQDIPLKDFRTADFNTDTIPYPDNMFDTVTAWCVLAHLENPHHFIREIHRILKPGGVLIATIPNTGASAEKRSFSTRGEFIAYKPHNDHISIWTPSLMRKTTERYFDIVGEDYLVKEKNFRGFRGWLRRICMRYWPSLQRRWGSKVAYVLKKK